MNIFKKSFLMVGKIILITANIVLFPIILVLSCFSLVMTHDPTKNEVGFQLPAVELLSNLKKIWNDKQ